MDVLTGKVGSDCAAGRDPFRDSAGQARCPRDSCGLNGVGRDGMTSQIVPSWSLGDGCWCDPLRPEAPDGTRRNQWKRPP